MDEEFMNEVETGWTKAEGGESGAEDESGAGERRGLKRGGRGKRRAGSKESEPKAAGEEKILKQSGRERRSEEENRVGRTRLK